MAGPLGFFKGIGARVLYSMPATAICWSTYEFAKFILSRKSREDYQSSVTTVGAALTPKDVIAAAAEKVRIDDASGKIGLRYVLPTTSASSTADVNFDDELSTTVVTTPSTTNSTPLREPAPTSLMPRELPSMSGAGVYSALSLNTMHTETSSGRNFDRGCNR